MERMLLERRACEVEIVGRRFLLEEMSGSDVERLILMQAEPIQRLSSLGETSDVESVERSIQASSDALVSWLLSRPADDGPPADQEFLAQVSPSMRQQLVEVQERLNDLENLPGNSLSRLQRRLMMARLSQTATSAGPRS